MSLPRAEVPGGTDDGRRAQGPESLPKITTLTRGLYALTLYFLGAALLLLIVGWVVLTAMSRPVPEGLPVVVATIVGAFVGVIATDKAK